MTDVLTFCRERLAAYAEEPILPPPLLTGDDVIALGHAQGPEIGRILRWVQDEQLEGRLQDKEDAVRRVREKYPEPTGDAPGDPIS